MKWKRNVQHENENENTNRYAEKSVWYLSIVCAADSVCTFDRNIHLFGCCERLQILKCGAHFWDHMQHCNAKQHNKENLAFFYFIFSCFFSLFSIQIKSIISSITFNIQTCTYTNINKVVTTATTTNRSNSLFI